MFFYSERRSLLTVKWMNLMFTFQKVTGSWEQGKCERFTDVGHVQTGGPTEQLSVQVHAGDRKINIKDNK